MEETKEEKTQEPVGPLDPMQELEKRLTALIEAKQKETEERFDQLEDDIDQRFGEADSRFQESAKSVKGLESLIKTFSDSVQYKVNAKDFDAYSKQTNASIKELTYNLKATAAAVGEQKSNLVVSQSYLEIHKKWAEDTAGTVQKDLALITKRLTEAEERMKDLASQDSVYDNLEKIRASARTLDSRVTTLYNNINPCALLLRDNDVSSHAEELEKAPDAFLKHLFDTFHDGAKQVMEQQNRKIRHMEDLLDALKKNFNANIYTSAKKAFQQLSARGEIAAGSADVSRLDELRSVVSKKCDAAELVSMGDAKANKSDLETLQGRTDELYKQLAYTVLMLTEFTTILTSNGNESKTEKVSRLGSVAYQVSLLNRAMTRKEASRPADASDSEETDTNPAREHLAPAIVIRSSPKKHSRAQTRLESQHPSAITASITYETEGICRRGRSTAGSYKTSMGRLRPVHPAANLSYVGPIRERCGQKRSLVRRQNRPETCLPEAGVHR